MAWLGKVRPGVVRYGRAGLGTAWLGEVWYGYPFYTKFCINGGEQVKKFRVKIRGIAPLLQHRFPEPEKEKAERKKVGVVDWSKEVEEALYRKPDGTIYEPSTHIEGAMIKAASSFQIPGRGKKTYKDLFKSAVIVEPMEIPLEPQKYTVDRRPVVMPGGRIMRSRPKFENWELTFDIVVSEEELRKETVEGVLKHAGSFIGIGDFRPKFGRFEVVEFKDIT